jgi:RNA:NAD 2'-phosphotransferase (TPT1/KptA family)
MSSLPRFQVLRRAASSNIWPHQNIIPNSPHQISQMDHPKNNKDKRGRGQGQSRDVQVSKALSLLLRHAAEKEGLKMNTQGYASVSDVVCSFAVLTICHILTMPMCS